MAQLKDTTINGNLSVTGNVSSSATPTDSNHVANKSYVDGIGTTYVYDYYPVGNNVTGASRWNTFTQSSYNITLPKGTYLIVYSVTCTVGGTGILTVMMGNNGDEMDNNRCSRQTVACSTAGWSTINASFVLTVDESTDYSFNPQVWGSVSWTGQGARIQIIKMTA